MPPISVTQDTFTGGEWAPSLWARVDLAKYATATRLMRNNYAHPHGPVSNRAGSIFTGETKDSSKVSRLIPFQFSVVQAYALEFGDQYMRVYKDDARVVESDVAMSGATQADPVVVTTGAAHGYLNGEWIYFSGVVGMTELNGKIYVVANKTATTFELKDVDGNDIDGTGFTAYSSGGICNRIYELATPYLEADLALLKIEQSADVLTVNHPSYEERQITRTDHDAWTITATTIGASITAPANLACAGGTDVDYVVTAVSGSRDESLPPTSVQGAPDNALTWDTVSGADYYNIYKDNAASGTFGWIGQATELTYTEPAAGIDPDFLKTPPISKDPFNGANNYPGCGAYHEQRFVRARTNNKPQTIYGSVVGNFDNHNISSPLQDDDAYEFTLNARQVNEIRWMVSLKGLVIGTSGSEWKALAGNNSDAITPTSIDNGLNTRYGVSDVQPVIVGNTLLFIEGSKNVVRDMRYVLEEDGYKADDVSILSNHFFNRYQLTEWAYQQHPNSIIWAVRNDGILLGLTYYREHEVWGWHQHDTDGFFESVITISTTEGVDQLYVIVKRTINGVTRRYVEVFAPRLPFNANFETDVQDAFFVDCGLTFDNPVSITGATQADPCVLTIDSGHGIVNGDTVDITAILGMTELNLNGFKVANVGATTVELTDEDGNDIDSTAYSAYVSGGQIRKAVTVITGLDHLEGKDVSILANGGVVPGLTVADGSITLPHLASRVHIGLGYVSDLETLDFEFPTETGTIQDKQRLIPSAVLSLVDTNALWVGPDADHLVEAQFRKTEKMGQPTQLFTGDKEELLYAPDSAREGRVFIRNVDPLPCTVSAIIARETVGEF